MRRKLWGCPADDLIAVVAQNSAQARIEPLYLLYQTVLGGLALQSLGEKDG